MQVIEIKRYAFSELSKEAQDNAIEKARLSEYKDYPQGLLSDYMDQEASYLLSGSYDGLDKDIKIYYDLSHSQGSGVCFQGVLTPESAPKLNWPANSYRLNIAHSGRYYHEHSFSVELLDENYDELESDDLLEQLRDICRKLEKAGYKWEENYFSDESMRSQLEEAGEVFTLAGRFSDPERE